MGIESLFLLLPAFTAVIYREPELLPISPPH